MKARVVRNALLIVALCSGAALLPSPKAAAQNYSCEAACYSAYGNCLAACGSDSGCIEQYCTQPLLYCLSFC